MEIPAGEDLEMASPYHGQADDFDIDIDLMEDHASNMDSDMMGADDFPNNSQPSLFQNDATDDADMVDEPSEGSMVDVENLVDEDQDIDVQYDDVTYEAEMLEDEEPVHAPAPAPVPAINIEPTNTTTEPQIAEPINLVPETVTEVNKEPQAVEIPPVLSTFENNEPDVSSIEKPSLVESTPAEPSKIEQTEADQSAPAGADQSQTPVGGEQTNDINTNDENAADEPEASEPPVEETQASVQNDTENTEQQEMSAAHDADHQDTHEEPLHPIKVLYQDNEISLFPPVEGNLAETFFVHDEDVTYEPLEKLFSSLREVLEESLFEHDVLVIDIESVGLQIAEVSLVLILLCQSKTMLTAIMKDSSCTSKITLQQILDVYLRLCHNDGNHQPDPLYLSLHSKPAVYSELASLEAAAKEGKGLSQFWEEYYGAEQTAEGTDNVDGQPSEEPEHGEEDAQQDQQIHEQGLPNDEAASQLDQSNVEENVASKAPQEVDVGEQDAEPHSNVSEQGDAQEEIEDHGDPTSKNEATEAPGTESIATPVPNTESTVTAQSENAPTDATRDHENDYAENEDVQDPSLEDFDDDISGADDLEVADLTVPGGEHDDQDYENDFDPDDDTSHNELTGADPEATEQTEAAEQAEATEQDGLNPADGPNDAPNDAPDDDFDPDVYEESESTVENAPGDDHSHEQNPDLEDDLLEISEDVFQDPSMDDQHNESHNPDGVAQENPKGTAGAPPYEDFDEDDYNFDDPEFDATEGTELGELDTPATDSHANDTLSVKRSRDEEDEWDITEATTPELKRQRSS